MAQRIELADLPEPIREMPDPPKQLYIHANRLNALDDIMQRPRVAIVGSRKVSDYGITMTTMLAKQLAGQGIVIISGLAIGVDELAHQACLEAGGLTAAVLPGPVHSVYPLSHKPLASMIITSGGLLVSEYSEGTETYRSNFVARNRIVTALSNVLLITEAAQNSGTLHTARFALEQGIDVLAVPGNATSKTSIGTNNLIKAGATPVTEVNDVLRALNLKTISDEAPKITGDNPEQQAIINLLYDGVTNGNQLLRQSQLQVQIFNQNMVMLQISAKIRPLGADRWALIY